MCSDAASLVNHQVDEYLNNYSTWGVMIMEAILGSLDVKPDKLITARLCKELAPIALHHPREDVRVSACRLTAALINKFPEGLVARFLLYEVSSNQFPYF